MKIKKEDKNEKTENKNFIDAWKNAIEGIIYAVTTQRNIKIQLVIAVIVILISLLFNLNRAEFLCLMFTVILIIVAEMINTAIETVVDLYTDLYHPKAKIAKDVGAGAVVVSVLNAIIVAYFLFFDKISEIGLAFIDNLVNSPMHLAFIAVVLTIIAILTIKAFNTAKKNKKTYFIPSGFTAVAFSSLTIIWISTRNIVVMALSLLMAFIIAESRIEARRAGIAEIIVGACARNISCYFYLWACNNIFEFKLLIRRNKKCQEKKKI